MHQPTIARIEAGTRPVSLDELQALADAFGSRPGALVATEQDDDFTQAMNLFQERSARLITLADEVRVAEMALAQARARYADMSELVDEASDILATMMGNDPDEEGEIVGEPREEA